MPNPPFQPLTLSVEEWNMLGSSTESAARDRDKLWRECEAQAQAAASLRQRLEEVERAWKKSLEVQRDSWRRVAERLEREKSQAEAALTELQQMLASFSAWGTKPTRAAFAQLLAELQRRRSAPGQEKT